MQSYKDLDVWRASLELARDVYELTRRFPKEEQYGLVSQMRRSAVSVAGNIAEGAARQGTKEFIQFIYVAVGSAVELDTQLEISKMVGMPDADALNAIQEKLLTVIRMLRALIRSLKANPRVL